MPLKLRPLVVVNFRPKLVAALVAAFVLAFVAGDAARAQRRRAQPAASQQGANSNESAQKPARAKRVFVGQGSSSAQGSRQTIKSDDSLNDYSAYRSGDRFYVVLPKADASSVSKGAGGRGYSDMQVQQRGNDVVLSYKLQPGARPRVEQKFNRLDVVFDVPEGGQQAPDSGAGQAARTAPQNTPPAQNRSAGAQPSGQTTAQTAGQTAAQTAGANPATAARRPGAAESIPPAGATQQPSFVNAAPGAGVPPQPAPTAEAPAAAGQTPAATPAAEPQIAQAPPQVAAPAPGAAVATEAPAAGTTLGAALIRNWPLTLIVALLLVVGFGLLFAARRTSSAPRPTPEEELFDEEKTTTATAPLAEKRAARLKAESASAKPVPVPASKEKKDKSTAVTASAPSKEEEAKAEQPAVAEPAAAEPAVEEVAAASPVKEIALAESPAAEAAPAGVSAKAEASTGEIVPVVNLDPETVHLEVSRLLDGEGYDRAVVGTSDAMARQMLAAELLSALAGRNDVRRERARAAFVEHGYLEEATRDLRGAEAPAERAAAARALGLAGDHSATAHLVTALEDKAVEVRRAAVEALASLRDPAALAPLESLLEREKKQKTKVNRKVVLHAVESCRAAQAEAAAQPPEQASVEAPSPEVQTADVLTEPAAESRELAPFTEPTVVEAGLVTEAAEETAVEEKTVEIVPFVEAPSAEAEPEHFAEPEQLTEPEPFAAETHAVEPVASVEPSAEAQAQPSFEAEPPSPAVEEFAAEQPEVEAVAEVEPAGEAAPVEEPPAQVAEAAAVSEAAEVVEAAEPEEVTIPVEAEELTAAVEAEPVAPAEPETLEERLVETHEAIEPEVTAPQAEVAEVEFELTAPEPEVSTPGVEAAETEAAGPVGFEPLHEDEPQPLFEQQTLLAAEPALAEPAAEVAAPPQAAEDATAAGDWFEFDMSEVSAEASQPTEVRPTEVEPYSHGLAETAIEPVAHETAPASEALSEAEADVTSIAPFVEEPVAEPAGQRPETGIVARDEAEGVTKEVAVHAPAASAEEKGIEVFDEFSTVPASIQHRLASRETAERAEAVAELARFDTPDTFQQICAAFDDEAREVRSAAARALYDLRADRADSFTRALRESSPERRHNIGTAISASGLASEAISQLTGESREKTYEAFSLLFLMAKAGEVQPLIRAIEGHPSNDVRLAVVKLLALSGQKEILPAFRRLAVRGSLPTEVRSAVMEAIYQISSGQPTHAA